MSLLSPSIRQNGRCKARTAVELGEPSLTVFPRLQMVAEPPSAAFTECELAGHVDRKSSVTLHPSGLLDGRRKARTARNAVEPSLSVIPRSRMVSNKWMLLSPDVSSLVTFMGIDGRSFVTTVTQHP